MKTRAVILAGGEGSRLSILTAKRTKPAVPFAAKYRIIDFVLSNCVNSGIFDVLLVAQYRPQSLIEHIGAGGPWDLNRDFTGGVRIYTPYKARFGTDWFVGTADAVQQNFTFIKQDNPDYVMVLSGDHIYSMDYEPMLTFHRDHLAEVTLATMRVPMHEAPRFGIIDVGEDYRITAFTEKPANPHSNLINMGVYIFNCDVLNRALWEDHEDMRSSHDFGRDILPRLIREGKRVFAYPYSGYWVDVGTVSSYWQAHMDLLQDEPPIDLNDRSWIVHTRTHERPPARILRGGVIVDSLLSGGCVIEGGAHVERSILSSGVVVKRGAVIKESIILSDSVIGAGAQIERAILDKHVVVGEKARIGQMPLATEADAGSNEPVLALIGKNSTLPAGMIIEPGAVIGTDVVPSDFEEMIVKNKDMVLTKRKSYEV
jgi:glucose-1-phosphate adenylyltransferase